MKPGLPIDEAQRLACLREYEILDTTAEKDFDDLTRLASQICELPISMISFIDSDRQWFKSKVGLDVDQCPRDLSFCGHTILGKDVLIVEDALADERFADNPFVLQDPKIRFYAGTPLVDPAGHALGALCVVDRVPRRLRPEQIDALRALARQVISQMQLRRSAALLMVSERFAHSTVDAINACITTLDEAGNVLSTNRAWRHSNLERGFFENCGVGDNYLSMCNAAMGGAALGCASLADELRRVIAGELVEVRQSFQLGSARQNRWISVNANRFGGDGPVRLVVIHEDITQQKRNDELERERGGLRNAITSLEKVLGVVGHELRTPLAGMRAMTDFLLDPASRDTPEWSQFLSTLGDEVVRMSDTVDTLLEAARLNSGKARWNWSEFALEPICREVMQSVRRVSVPDPVELIWDVEPGAGQMRGDAAAIRRLLLNLVGNARKHTTAGKIEIIVRSRTIDGVRSILLTIRDTGEGIPPEILARVGEAFAMNSGVVGQHYVSGTGLGLAICKGIAAAHAGTITIESNLGAGTTVLAELRADLNGPADYSEEESGMSPISTEFSDSSMAA